MAARDAPVEELAALHRELDALVLQTSKNLPKDFPPPPERGGVGTPRTRGRGRQSRRRTADPPAVDGVTVLVEFDPQVRRVTVLGLWRSPLGGAPASTIHDGRSEPFPRTRLAACKTLGNRMQL